MHDGESNCEKTKQKVNIIKEIGSIEKLSVAWQRAREGISWRNNFHIGWGQLSTVVISNNQNM